MTNENKTMKPVRKTLRAENITRDIERFHVRDGQINPVHVSELTAFIKHGQTLSPLLVWQAPDGRFILADGYHRLAAYRRAGWTRGIPCLVYECDHDEARRLPLKQNGKTTLPLTAVQRSNAAWRLVLDTAWSRRVIVQDTGISPRQVARMRSVKRHLEEEGGMMPREWQEARRAETDAERDNWTEDDRNERENRLRDELLAEVGPALFRTAQRCPEAVFAATQKVLGHKWQAALDHFGYVERKDDDYDEFIQEEEPGGSDF